MIGRLFRGLLPMVAIALGIVAFMVLVETKPEVHKAQRENAGTVVEAMSATRRARRVVVRAHGKVIPARKVVLGPQVSGKVTWIHPELVPGGKFHVGESLLRLDGRDYALLLEAQSAQVDQAQTALELEKRRKAISKREWDLIGKKGATADPMTLRDQQVQTAQMAVKAAKSGRRRAKLNIGRTVMRAPFNAIVLDRAVDLGQLVGPGVPATTLAGTDAFWVQVSIPMQRLVWLDVPGVDGATVGSEAIVWRMVNDKRVEHTGRIVRLLGDVDPVGRMARVLVQIDDPLGLAPQRGGSATKAPRIPDRPALPMLLGSFVQVELHGREAANVVQIPREALRDGDLVYIMKPERIAMTEAFAGMLVWASDAERERISTIHTLDIRKVEVTWRQRDTVFVSAGIAPGEQIVTSPVPSPIQSMLLRTVQASSHLQSAAVDMSPPTTGERQQ